MASFVGIFQEAHLQGTKDFLSFQSEEAPVNTLKWLKCGPQAFTQATQGGWVARQNQLGQGTATGDGSLTKTT